MFARKIPPTNFQIKYSKRKNRKFLRNKNKRRKLKRKVSFKKIFKINKRKMHKKKQQNQLKRENITELIMIDDFIFFIFIK